MKKQINSKKILKKIILTFVFVYVAYILINQQQTLNSYRRTEAFYSNQIETKTAQRESLTYSKENINSLEFIETMARERLDMFLPNERVFVNIVR